MLREEFVARGALVEIERLAALQHFDSRHRDFHQRGIELHSGPACRRKNPAPVRIAAREGGFYQWRSRDRFRNLFRRGFCFCARYFNFNHALRAFAVGTICAPDGRKARNA